MNKKLIKLINLSLANPPTKKQFCYRDESETTWRQDEIVHRAYGPEVIYRCKNCGTKRHYNNAGKELKGEKG